MAITIDGTFNACNTLGFSLSDLVSSCVFGNIKKQNIVAQHKTPPKATKGKVNPPSSYSAPPTVGPEIQIHYSNINM